MITLTWKPLKTKRPLSCRKHSWVRQGLVQYCRCCGEFENLLLRDIFNKTIVDMGL